MILITALIAIKKIREQQKDGKKVQVKEILFFSILFNSLCICVHVFVCVCVCSCVYVCVEKLNSLGELKF